MLPKLLIWIAEREEEYIGSSDKVSDKPSARKSLKQQK